MADYDWFREPRIIPEYEKWGFSSVYRLDYVVSCPLCQALVLQDRNEKYKEDASWWKHIQWHVSKGEHWDWQPREQE
jgi:hypothetical protein